MTRLRELICEGACNPGVAQLDYQIAQYRAEERHEGGVRLPIVDEAIVARLRRLRHTPHLWVSPDRWACVDCDHERRSLGV